jgi:hypothetical protein
LIGTSFGTSGIIMIGPNECKENTTQTMHNHTRIVCLLPPGEGPFNDVLIQVSGKFSTTRNFKYDNVN